MQTSKYEELSTLGDKNNPLPHNKKTCFTPSLTSYSLKDNGLECRKMEMSLYTAFQLPTLKDIITSPPILLINTIGRNQHMIRK